MWQPISTAPRGYVPFIALNVDREVWVCRMNDYGKLEFRTNTRYEPRRYDIVWCGGEELLREDKEFAEKNEKWQNAWCCWTRLYTFDPTHWMPLPPPPADQ